MTEVLQSIGWLVALGLALVIASMLIDRRGDD